MSVSKGFIQPFNDHQYGNGQSMFSQHWLDKKHSIGSIENTMDIVYITNKGNHMNIGEISYIQSNRTGRLNKWYEHSHAKYVIRCNHSEWR